MKKTRLKILMRHLTQLFLIVMCSILTVYGQTKVISIVTNESGLAVAGVNILETGSQNDVVTDFDGDFSMTLEKDSSELTMTYLGYGTLV
ncbi:carboxypeptidase-like regulatory domain-containing protein [Flavivirga rizhaonensis]|uniref:Carboxypeptidase-like regulatory domain-containing protein n=1 Tax=Flavivirga rizhaonensis TaxID=2559571 RepID=A0A4S1E2K1_9FLAO|nr:carboxypeptidase-like regulatory domain-containing protein [Flavivirga rizhaonensis]TGV04759.1 hypothetical protein EM932_01145 [Flavivirga rizhaonensis]